VPRIARSSSRATVSAERAESAFSERDLAAAWLTVGWRDGRRSWRSTAAARCHASRRALSPVSKTTVRAGWPERALGGCVGRDLRRHVPWYGGL